MPRAIRISRVTDLVESLTRFDRGLVSGLSQPAKPVRHLIRSSNLTFDPETGFSSRPGYRDVSLSVLPFPAHSLMAYYGTPDDFFVGAGTKLYEINEGGGYAEQVLPGTWSAERWCDTNLNGVLIAAQEGGANSPIAYNGGWLTIVLPTPGAGLAAVAAATTGAGVDAGLHKYRIRWRFKNGSSLAGPSIDHTVVAGPNQNVSLSGIPQSGRSDFLGWTVERTKVGFDTLWWRVADGTGTSYIDNASDASLGELIGAEPGVHGAAPHLEGVVAWRNRLWGWAGTTLYVSQAVADPSEASGIFNFHPSNQFPIDADDGDTILQVVDAGDRLVIFKHSSIHVVEGYDLDNFLRRRLPTAVGGASTRGAVVIAGRVYFYGGDGRFYVLKGNREEEIGDTELDAYIANMNVTREREIVAFGDLKGRYACFAIPFSSKNVVSDIVGFEIKAERWVHHDNIGVADVLEPKEPGAFGRARLLIADPTLLPPSSTQTAGLNPSYHIWSDARAGAQQYYVQKFSSTGSPQWSPGDGVLVSVGNVTPLIDRAACIPDGAGGMICAFIEGTTNNNGQIILQRIDSGGSKLWGAGGVQVSPAATTDRKDDVEIVSDGSGGAIVMWLEHRGASGQNGVYAQRVNSSGVVQWTAGGVEVVAPGGVDTRNIKTIPTTDFGVFASWYGAGTMKLVRLTSAGAIHGGWGGVKNGPSMGSAAKASMARDNADGFFVATGNFVQGFVGASGAAAFTAKDLTATISSSVLSEPSIVSDGAGGIIAVYWAGPFLPHQILAQRVSANGTFLWNANGVPMASAILTGSYNFGPRAVQDGEGGAVLVWQHSGAPYQIHAQRVTPGGATLWGNEGTIWRDFAISGESSISVFRVCSDGAGGIIMLWQDDRPGPGNLNNLYIQRVLSNGTQAWTLDGVQVCAQAGNQDPHDSEFTGAVETEFPSDALPGYHVWAAFEGELDRLGADGTGGVPIPFFAQTPFSDDGYEDVEKEYNRIRIEGKLGAATLNVAIMLDNAQAGDSVPITVDQPGTRWGTKAVLPDANTLIWGQGRWAQSRSGEVVAPFRQGVFGKKASLVISSQLVNAVEINAIDLDYSALPDRSYVR